MTANTNWPEHIQQQSAAQCFSCFFSSYFLQLYLCTLASAVAHFTIQEASSFYIHDFRGSKFCSSLIDNISLRISCHNIRNFPQFSIACRNCPPTRYTANVNLLHIYIYIHTHIHTTVYIYIQ